MLGLARTEVSSVLPSNPLRLLPRSYATYNSSERKLADGGREDVERDRRLSADEERRIRAILRGDKPKGKQRAFALNWQAALECLFDLALETAMRLGEVYTLDQGQVHLRERTIFLDKTKNGDRRQVPLSTAAVAAIERYRKHIETGTGGMSGFSSDSGLVFPWWNGKPTGRPRTTSALSRQFGRVFDAAGCPDLRFHDLRHEATCRLYERTSLSDLQISRITGHKDMRMLRRYANLRGSDLADRLW